MRLPGICEFPIFNVFSRWTMWADVETFVFDGCGYLLQARRHRNGKCQFRLEAMGNKPSRIASCTKIKFGDSK